MLSISRSTFVDSGSRVFGVWRDGRNRGVDQWREGCCLLRGLECRRGSLERRL